MQLAEQRRPPSRPRRARGLPRRYLVWGGVALALVGVVVGAVMARQLTAPAAPAASIVHSGTLRCVNADALAAAEPDAGLTDPLRRDIALMLVSSAENSTLLWEQQFGYIAYNVEGNDAENRGYTAGIVGFTSRTQDLLAVVEAYERAQPGNALSPFLEALRAVDGTPSTEGLGDAFVAAWQEAADDPVFREVQLRVAVESYVDPAVEQAMADGLGALGQFAYVDAMVMHGPGPQPLAFGGIREAALEASANPAQGGRETDYLGAFLDAREDAMRAEVGHRDTTRVSTGQRRFLEEGNLALEPPLEWSVYGDDFAILPDTDPRCAAE